MSDTARQIDSYNAGLRGGIPLGGSAEEMAAYAEGQRTARERGGGGGGGGAAMLVPLVFIAPIAFVVGTCLYPLAGVLTLALALLITAPFDDGKVGFLMLLLLVLMPCFFAFIAGLALERTLERHALYRALRHVVRVVFMTFVAHVVVFSFTGAGRHPPSTPFLDRLSVLHVALVAAAAVGAHFLSRRLDRDKGGRAHRLVDRFDFLRRRARSS